MSKISERLKEIMKENNLSIRTLADKMGVSDVMAGKYVNDKSKPGLEAMQKIIESFPNISSNWILTGEGSIYEKEGRLDNESVALYVRENHEKMIKEVALYDVWFKSQIKDGVIEYLEERRKQGQ